jgi:hypothetical protein
MFTASNCCISSGIQTKCGAQWEIEAKSSFGLAKIVDPLGRNNGRMELNCRWRTYEQQLAGEPRWQKKELI